MKETASPSKALTIGKFIASIIICQAAGLIGSLFTTAAIPTWYATLNKPAFTPPNWLFAPVWFILYLMMGISLFLVWNGLSQHTINRIGIAVFFLQLVFNILWSIAFFGLRSPLYGVIVIAILWLSIIATIRIFYITNRQAAILLIPYLLWTTFAAVLNIAILTLNLR